MTNKDNQTRSEAPKKRRGRPAKHGVYSVIRRGEVPPEHAELAREVDGEIAQYIKELGGDQGLNLLDRALLANLRTALLVVKLVDLEVRAHGLSSTSLLNTCAGYMNATRRIMVTLSRTHKPIRESNIEVELEKYRGTA